MIFDTDISSVNEYIIFIIRKVASGNRTKTDNNLTAGEVKTKRDRQRRLDYIEE